HTVEQQARPFSVRQWVREGAARQAGGKGGVLFLPYRASQIASLRSVISAWMRLGIFEAMDRPVGDQRLWFIVDELDARWAVQNRPAKSPDPVWIEPTSICRPKSA